MSATIHYRRTDKKDPTLPINAPSHFLEIMERAFGELPIRVDSASVPTIMGMIAAEPGMAKDFQEVVETIQRVGAIEIWAS
jgi:hypothetical protein